MEAANNLLRRRLQTKLNTDLKLKMAFKNIAHCATHATENNGTLVVRRTDKRDAKFIGLNHCGNAWLCPNCAPRAAEKMSKCIAGALEVAEQNKQKAFMITLTIGHYRAVPLKLLLDALNNTFKNIFTQSTQKTGGYKFMKEFYADVPRKHFIRTTEITWSYQFGWHPHIHMLYFVNDSDWDHVLKWEEKLNAEWMKATQKYLTSHIKKATFLAEETKEEMISEVAKVYERKLDRTVGLHLAKDKDGNLIKQVSADYITGWGANKELSDKEAKTCKQPGHFSIMQILENAVTEDEAKKTLKSPELNFWWKLFFEIGYAVYKRCARWSWSHTGLKKQALKWLEHLSEDEYKKKFMDKAKSAEWQTVCYIPSELYAALCKVDNFFEIEQEILNLAMDDDYNAICELFKKRRLPEPPRNAFFEIKGILKAA